MDETEEIRQADDEQQQGIGQEPEPETEQAGPDEAVTGEQGQEEQPAPEPEQAPEAGPDTLQEEGPEEGAKPARTFTQEDVDRIVGKTRAEARERGRKEFLDEMMEKYGLEDVSQLDDMVGSSEKYEELNGQQEGLMQELESLKNENLLLRAGIDQSRFDDVYGYFQYKGIPLNPLTLEEALESHPEWDELNGLDIGGDDGDGGDVEGDAEPASVIRRIGAEPSRRNASAPKENEYEAAMNLFGLRR